MISIRALLQWLCQAGRQWSGPLPRRQYKNELVTSIDTPLPLLDETIIQGPVQFTKQACT